MPVARKTRRRWFQFGTKGLIVFIGVVGVVLGFLARWHHRALRQRAAVAELSSGIGIPVSYEEGFNPDTDQLPIPNWLQKFFGVDHFYNVVDVTLNEATESQCRCVYDLPALETLSLRFGPESSGDALYQLGRLSRLKSLDLRGEPKISDRIMAVIGSMKRLESLSIDCGDRVTDDGVAELARLANLKSLTLRCGWQISDAGLAHLGRLSRLEGLRLDLDQESNCSLVYLPGIAGPFSMTLMLDEPKRGRALTSLADLKRLKRLVIDGGVLFSEETFSQIGQLAELRKLDLEVDSRIRPARGNVRAVGPESRGLNDKALAHLAKLAKLELLVITTDFGEETDQGLAELAKLGRLRMLDLRLGPNVNDDGLAKLADCPSLQRVRLHLNDLISGSGLAQLENLVYLELDLKLRSKEAAPIQLHLPHNLEDLVIHGGESLTDDQLAGLVELGKLRQLDFWHCERLTDAGLEHLKQLSQLEDLSINWCSQVNFGEISALRTAMPKCKIEVRSGPGNIAFWDRLYTTGR